MTYHYSFRQAFFCFLFWAALAADTQAQTTWAKGMGSTGADIGRSIAVDGSGNVYTTGYFSGTADFDPGAGTLNLTSAGGNDIFVSKLDASGNLVWAKRMGSTVGDIGYGIAVDGSGNVYTTGYFSGTADFDPGAGTLNLTSAGGNDIFVSKLDASGNLAWAKGMGGTAADIGNGITVDGSGNVYTTGSFQGTVDFDPGAGTLNLTSAGGTDIFVSKLDASGNLAWAKGMGGTGNDQGNGIAVDGSGSVYTTGSFQATADFDPGTGTLNLTSGGSNDIFVSKHDALGNLPVTLRYFNGRMTDAGALLGWATATEHNNAYFLLERSRDLIGFEAIASLPSQATSGNSALPLTYAFTDTQPLPGVTYYRLTQVDQNGTRTTSRPIALSKENQPPVLYPNPVGTLGEATLEPALAYRSYEVVDMQGRVVQQAAISGTLSRLSVGTLPTGVYLLRVQTEGGSQQVFRLLR